MEHDPTPWPVVPKPEFDFLKAVDRGMYVGVQRALAEHKRMGRPIVIGQDGQIVEIPPEDIVVAEEFADPPIRKAR